MPNWTNHLVGALLALLTIYGLDSLFSSFSLGSLATVGFVAYLVGVTLSAWIRTTLFWLDHGESRRTPTRCGGCGTRVFRIDGDWILECKRCGWRPGFPIVRWLWHSVPMVQARRRSLLSPLIRTSLVAGLVVGVLILSIGGIGLLGPGAEMVTDTGSDVADGASAAAVDATSTNETKIRMAIHQQVNEERTSRGLPALSYSQQLEDVAQYHSDDMAEEGYFSHESPAGVSMKERYRRHGAPCIGGGENIYKTQSSASAEEALARETVDAWMNSPGHRRNILRERFNSQALGIAEGDGWVYVTQNFC